MDRLVIGAVIEVMLAAMKSEDYKIILLFPTAMLLAAMKSEDYKIIALFPTARLVGYFAVVWINS
jgi:hypothetical protein